MSHFRCDRQTDRQTDGHCYKNNMPPPPYGENHNKINRIILIKVIPIIELHSTRFAYTEKIKKNFATLDIMTLTKIARITHLMKFYISASDEATSWYKDAFKGINTS